MTRLSKIVRSRLHKLPIGYLQFRMRHDKIILKENVKDFYKIDGEKYYFIKGKIYDSGFLEPDITTLRKVAPAILRVAFPSPENMEREGLIDYSKKFFQ